MDNGIYTYKEVKDFVIKQDAEMSKEEISYRIMNCDPTFETFILSSMKETDKVEILGQTNYKIKRK